MDIENFYWLIAIMCIFAIVITVAVVKKLTYKPTEFWRYVFIHPSGLDYMRKNKMEPKSFIIPDGEDMLFIASKHAKEYAKKHPYWKVTVTNLTNNQLEDITRWESVSTYFDLYDKD